MRHPKFKHEKVCPVCDCSFLPGVGGQTQCLGCNPNPQPEALEDAGVGDGMMELLTGKVKSCKKCGVVFEYTHPAAKYCDGCKK